MTKGIKVIKIFQITEKSEFQNWVQILIFNFGSRILIFNKANKILNKI